MLLYILIIIISIASITLLNTFCNPMGEPWWYYLIFTTAAVIVVIAIDGVVATIIRKMPEKYFSYKKKIYNASDKEMHFYKKLKVDRWKNYIPELGGFTSFHKNKVVDPFNNEYIGRFILESCYGYSIHLWSIPFAFLLMLGDYQMYYSSSNLYLTICLPIALISGILNILPAMILKFNLKRLINIQELNEWKDNKNTEQ